MVRVSQPMNTIDKSCYIMLYMFRVSQMNTIVKSCYIMLYMVRVSQPMNTIVK